MGRAREEKRRRKEIKKIKSQNKENPSARKGRNVAKHCVLAKAAGAEPSGQMRD